jgi:hypothetical protein
LLLPFLAGPDGVSIQRVVDGKHSIQMIDFVLQQHGKCARGFEPARGAIGLRYYALLRPGGFGKPFGSLLIRIHHPPG